MAEGSGRSPEILIRGLQRRSIRHWEAGAVALQSLGAGGILLTERESANPKKVHIPMGLMHVTVALKGLGSSGGSYESDFLVDTGATDCVAPAAKLRQIDVQPAGTTVYELADGTTREYPFGLVEIRFMGEVTAGRVVFGPDDAEPLLGVTALESVGITVDPANRTLKRLPAIPLKRMMTKLRIP